MKVINTFINGLKIIEPQVHVDNRGFFLETYSEEEYCELIGRELHFVQDNHSRSTKGVLRGLHFQSKHPQGKLVRVTRGIVFDVAVDLRINSQTFGKWFGIILSEENKRQLWLPEGFAHGFQVLSDIVDFEYKCTDYYYPEFERTLLWNDADVNIAWPLPLSIISEKDKRGHSLSEIKSYI
ncbi:TPA: dTDP-4-dehydrorhamnose 3,5-epimerase [Escherichia coli]|nr:dTDP-4-dehydrorhamnose 3,5-epimerase [Escherichia coli]